MCWCNPSNRTPFCGRLRCVAPQKSQPNYGHASLEARIEAAEAIHRQANPPIARPVFNLLNLGIGAYASKFAQWMYRTTHRLEDVLAAGYFDGSPINQGDFVLVSAADGGRMLLAHFASMGAVKVSPV